MDGKKIALLLAVFTNFLFLSPARADVTFRGVTVGINVKNLKEATSWYQKLAGEKPTLKPIPNINEIEVVKGFWLQLVEAPKVNPGDSVIRLGVTNIESEKERLAKLEIDIGEIKRVEGLIAFSEFSDPYGNKLSLYQVLTSK
ncbi:MAG: VOC family protein [Bdellovibrionota bacterium]|nr:VOC family protein [Bdellovibrionota bacterium]